jgi:subtilisin family serine protease
MDNSDNETDTQSFVSRRRLMQGVAGIGTAAWLSNSVSVAGSPGGGSNGSPPGGDDTAGNDEIGTVTLITGQTIHISESGGERHYTIASEQGSEALHFVDLDSESTLEAGTYAFPTGVALDRFSPLLFNIDFLVEQGLTDDETDVVPVIVMTDTGSDQRDVQAHTNTLGNIDGFTSTTSLASIDAVAGEVDKERNKNRTENGDPSTADRLASTASITHVYLDTRHEALLDVSAPAINAPAARERFGVDGSGISIAVLDTGIDADHPDFGNRVVHQKDFSGDGVEDVYGHGTHVAGIAAGAGTVSDGTYVGIAPGSSLLNIKVLGDRGFGRISGIIAGIEHAVAKDADVISMSLGGAPQDDGPLAQATNQAVKKGVVAVVAAGNAGGYTTIGTPGIAEKAITVGATTNEGEIARFSSGGPTPFEYRVKPEIAAPGVNITATGSHASDEYPYTEKSGTSMSTPHVSGLVALLREHDPDRSPEAIKHTLVATADPVSDINVFKQGGGEVNALAALDAPLRVRDAVVNFGVHEPSTRATETITLENTGKEPIRLDVAVESTNVQSGNSIADHVSVTPTSVEIAPDTTHDLTLDIETDKTYGFNSGTITLTSQDGSTYRSIFGFVTGLSVTVEKRPHENSGGVAGDFFYAYAHTGETRHAAFRGFNADGQYSFVLLDDGGEYTFWSVGQLQPAEGELFGAPTYTIQPVTIDTGQTQFTLNENATVPRTLDTSRASRKPFAIRTFEIGLYGTPTGGPPISFASVYGGDISLRTAYFSPIAANTPTNISTRYLMVPEQLVGEYSLDSPAVYDLFYGALSVPSGKKKDITVDPDDLATERFEYYRNYDNQLYSIVPIVFPADEENFPTFFDVGFQYGISDYRVTQTWHRTHEASYQETWFDDLGFGSSDWQFNRLDPFVPEKGATYEQAFNREPLINTLSAWDRTDETLTITGHWYADQTTRDILVSTRDSHAPNEYSVAIDGEVVDSGTSTGPTFTAQADGVSPGNVVNISLQGNTLVGTARKTTTITDYDYTVTAGKGSMPPKLASVKVAGLDSSNEVPAGPIAVFVTVDTQADSATVEGFYAETGTVSTTPFENASEWIDAENVYSDGGVYGFVLDTTGLVGPLDMAFKATDNVGNIIQHTTFSAITVSDGASVAAPIDIRSNTIAPTASQQVSLTIKGTNRLDPADIATDTLRFGAPDAVYGYENKSKSANSGRGASPLSVQQRGGDLRVQFAANETGLDCETDTKTNPAAGQLVGKLTDGTQISGANVIRVVCSGSK